MFWRSLEWLEEELLKKMVLSRFWLLVECTVHILSEQSLSSKPEDVQNYKISLG